MAFDWIETLRPLHDSGWRLVDGKFEPKDTIVAIDLPWVFAHVDFDCTVWNKIFHEVVTQGSQVHSHCHDCIKIVAKPKTLKDLVTIEAIQQDMLFPCKCGIDRRDNTQATYAAFWYNRGFPEARFRYKEIRKRFDAEGLEHVEMIIKKGCTEFENRIGPSTDWPAPDEEQLEREKGLLNHIRYTPTPPTSIPELVENHTHHLWINWAFQHGDNTYLEFTDEVPIHEPLVTFDPEGDD